MQSLIYLLRHGEVDSTRPRRFLGQADIPLNANGIHQAREVGRALAEISFQHVFSSPLSRALLTAELVSGRPQKAIQTIEAFKEINLGAWEGLTATEVQEKYPGAYEQRGENMGSFRPPNGESFTDVAARALPALQKLTCTDTGPFLIVAHAGVNRALLATISNSPFNQLLDIPQGYCGLNIICRQKSSLQIQVIDQKLF